MRFKKILAAASAAAIMSVGSVFNVSASATDPNGDGYCNVADVIYIYSYLRGEFYLSNDEDLDFTNNGVITQMDAYQLQLYVAGAL